MILSSFFVLEFSGTWTEMDSIVDILLDNLNNKPGTMEKEIVCKLSTVISNRYSIVNYYSLLLSNFRFLYNKIFSGNKFSQSIENIDRLWLLYLKDII